jgi:hypothetical protein
MIIYEYDNEFIVFDNSNGAISPQRRLPLGQCPCTGVFMYCLVKHLRWGDAPFKLNSIEAFVETTTWNRQDEPKKLNLF